MKLTKLSVQNFKALRDVTVPLSRFVCVIGENNAGKSSLLQALLLLIEGRKIEASMCFDPALPVVIALRLEEISEPDLLLITDEEHRTRLREILQDGSLTLVRRYDATFSSRLGRIAKLPVDSRFGEEYLGPLLKGKKPGTAFADELKAAFPEIAHQIDLKTNQTQARQLVAEAANAIPNDQKQDVEADLPTGIDNAVRPLLPVPIYIPAVKDFADEIATKDSASFGKLLGILLDQIAPTLEDARETFDTLRRNLNRMRMPDGAISDMRLEAVRNIETVVQAYVRENFPRVEIDIRIPPPEIKTVLSGAEIWVDDGALGIIDTKGDGLKRTITFSILRAFVELRRMQSRKDTATNVSAGYLFLFEEPELYLHPSAQGVLFEALGEISKLHHVVASTHSPMFFSAETTQTFIKLTKTRDQVPAARPFTTALWVDLGILGNKSRFQIISYETNNMAFFHKTVVLVEGDSELIVLPHIARTIDASWTPEQTGVGFCKIGGKGNIARYRDFFSAFGARLCVITDLDCIIEGFNQLQPTAESIASRERLIRAADEYAVANNIEGRMTSREIKEMQESPTRREQFGILKEKIRQAREGTISLEELTAAEGAFFSEIPTSRRRQVLEDSSSPEILAMKRELLRILRSQGIFVLERGTIEKYYPSSVTGGDKPSKAIDFCAQVSTRDELLNLCDSIVGPQEDPNGKEFCQIFSSIFRTD